MPNEILTDMPNSFDWYGKMFDWYEKKLTDMKKTVDWYGKNHISQTFLTDMVLTPPDENLTSTRTKNYVDTSYKASVTNIYFLSSTGNFSKSENSAKLKLNNRRKQFWN